MVSRVTCTRADLFDGRRWREAGCVLSLSWLPWCTVSLHRPVFRASGFRLVGARLPSPATGFPMQHRACGFPQQHREKYHSHFRKVRNFTSCVLLDFSFVHFRVRAARSLFPCVLQRHVSGSPGFALAITLMIILCLSCDAIIVDVRTTPFVSSEDTGRSN